ncbi:MAG: NAD-dependent epimerase/dehydratase family protein [Proteobacteria bacterium]|nr:MAG: NAD-dependent epimerase/dehydratase family protein [Pseudomonadota bacterium]
MKVLITAGGTKEYIDGVRFIGNSSSGRTGSVLADYLSAKGHSVVWLGADTAIRPQKVADQHHFIGYQDLASQLQKLLSNNHYDVIFHAAAVSDYQLVGIRADGLEVALNRQHKINSQAETLQLTLTKQAKIINQLLDWSVNKEVKVVGFKLTHTKDLNQQQQAVEKLLVQPAVFAVAHNDLNDISRHAHPFNLYVKGRDTYACDDIKAVVNVLMTLWEMG